MRGNFEAWAREHIGAPDFSGHHGRGGLWVYTNHHIMQLCWECWCASARSNRQPPTY